jgi:hypothetical protein
MITPFRCNFLHSTVASALPLPDYSADHADRYLKQKNQKTNDQHFDKVGISQRFRDTVHPRVGHTILPFSE